MKLFRILILLAVASARGAMVANPFTTNAIPTIQSVAPVGFVWMATTGKEAAGDGTAYTPLSTSLFQSTNGTNFAQSSSFQLYDPNTYSNSVAGPINGKWSLLFNGGQWWGARGHDIGGRGGLAQGVDLWRSCDLTNWSRETVLYPFGTTNNWKVLGANWFKDTNADVYLIMSVGPSNTTPNLIYAMKAVDSTLTNWGAASLIKGTDVTQEGYIARGTNGVYKLFYRCRWPALEWLIATNSANNLTSLFSPAVTNIGWGAFGAAGNSGGLSLMNVGGTHWRAYMKDESLLTMNYLDSLDDMATWSANWTLLPVTPVTNFTGGGVAFANSQSASRQTFQIGATNQGQVAILPPLMLANTIHATDGQFSGGLTAGSLFAPGSISSARALQGDSLIILPSVGGSNILNISTANFILDTDGNLTLLSYTAAATPGFSGDGSGLTGLPASQLSAGLVPVARLVANQNVNLFTVVNTNFLSGFIYTNFYGAPIQVLGTASHTAAGTMELRAIATATNYFSGTGTNELSIIVPANGTYTFSNTAGTGAMLNGGQIFVY